VFALLVPSCCDKSGISYHLVTRLMTVTDLLQVVPTRLIQAVRNKLLRACCHQLVNNLLRADDMHEISQLVNKMCSQCLFPVFDKSGTSCYHLVTRLMRPTDSQQVVPTSLISSARNKFLTS
jgi:hypothetical protein